MHKLPVIHTSLFHLAPLTQSGSQNVLTESTVYLQPQDSKAPGEMTEKKGAQRVMAPMMLGRRALGSRQGRTTPLLITSRLFIPVLQQQASHEFQKVTLGPKMLGPSPTPSGVDSILHLPDLYTHRCPYGSTSDMGLTVLINARTAQISDALSLGAGGKGVTGRGRSIFKLHYSIPAHSNPERKAGQRSCPHTWEISGQMTCPGFIRKPPSPISSSFQKVKPGA